MSFMMPPRSRSPVFSISTEPDEMHTLRTQIEAANAQQKYAKRHNTRSWRGSFLEDPLQLPDVAGQYECAVRAQRKVTSESMTDTTSLKSPIRSSRGLGGTIKSELSSARDLIKSTSRKQLQRLRTRATRSGTRRHASTTHLQALDLSGSDFVELSSEPPVAQLEDTQRSTSRSPVSRESLPLSYGSITELVQQETINSTYDDETVALCKKEYSCDNCRQHLTGKDFYDFCSMCDPCDRVLCIGCASRGGCWRHQQETMSALAPPSLCGSPAPSYNHDYRSAERHKRSPIVRKSVPSRASYVHVPISHLPHTEEPRTTGNAPSTTVVMSGSSSCRRGPDEKPALVAQLQHDFLREANQLLRQPVCNGLADKAIADREAALRDQQAAVREQQISLREETLLQRERETISRERDALFIRNLQTLALQSLVREQQIGSQFPAVKADDPDREAHSIDLKRSKSSSSQTSDISLETHAHGHTPRISLTSIVATAEAAISGTVSEHKHVKSCAEKRKKSEALVASNSSGTQHKSTGSKQSSKSAHQNDDNKETNEDGDDDLTPSKRQKKGESEQLHSRRNFACPYCKHDSQRYSSKNLVEMKYRNCATHYLPNIPRVKQHLQRVHWRPDNHCPRCFEVFRTPGELQEHFSCLNGCDRRECPFPEKMDRDQRRQVHVKRPNTPPEALWYDIYKILFPGATLPDSPYADEETTPPSPSAAPSVTTSDEAAQMLQQVFNEGLNRYNDTFDQRLRDLLNRVLEESMSTVFSKISVSPTPSPGAQTSRTPSIVVSPVTPSLGKKPRATGSPSIRSSGPAPIPLAGKVISRGVHMESVPLLQNPVRQHLAPALDPAIATRAGKPSEIGNADHATDTALRMPSPVRPDLFLQPPMLTRQNTSVIGNDPINVWGDCADSHPMASLSSLDNNKNLIEPIPYDAGTHVLDAGFDWHVPAHITEDQGYDDECSSFQKGDDRQAMEEMIRVRCANKSGNSIYSPVDSGYGSSNSIHPRQHAPEAERAQDGFDIHLGSHDATFMQHYHEWETLERQQQQQTQLDWHTHIGRAI